jgi:hypothetical protein
VELDVCHQCLDPGISRGMTFVTADTAMEDLDIVLLVQ